MEYQQIVIFASSWSSTLFVSMMHGQTNIRLTEMLSVVTLIFCRKYYSVRHYQRFYIKKNSVALVRERTTPTERPPPIGKVSANFLRKEG